MRLSKYIFSTIKKNIKNDSNYINNILINYGLIKKNCSGFYTFLPIGTELINNIKLFIKNEMININAMEIIMPLLQQNIFWNDFNNKDFKIFKTKSENNKIFILSPTNEKIIVNIIKNELILKKKFSFILYQIQTKFRDEIRPKSTILRTKEFIMKDAYSFHSNITCFKKTYNLIKELYIKIFNKLGIKNIYIVKDSLNFISGNNISHEFYSVSKYGEEKLIINKKTNYIKKVKNILNNKKNNIFNNIKNFNNLSYKEIINNNIDKNKLIKVYICNFNNNNYKHIMLIIKYNDDLCLEKISKIKNIQIPINILNKNKIKELYNINTDFLGLFDIYNIPLIIDSNAIVLKNFITSYNINNDKNFIFNINWNKYLNIYNIENISKNKNFKIIKCIELGHIFKLNDKYTKNLLIKKKIFMGCYGIGITRLLFSIIENNINNNYINWPNCILPFKIAILPILINKFKKVKKISSNIYYKLKKKYKIIFDDRINMSFGKKIKDLENFSVNLILIISNENLNKNIIEIKIKNNTNYIKINKKNIINYINKYFNRLKY